VAILSEIATSSEAPTIPKIDPNPVFTDTFGNNINSNNSSSNIASPSLNDDVQSLSTATTQHYSYNNNQTPYGKAGSQLPRSSVTPICPTISLRTNTKVTLNLLPRLILL
jgi:hypothetical protein